MDLNIVTQENTLNLIDGEDSVVLELSDGVPAVLEFFDRGPTGPPGPQGIVGPKGDKGDAGEGVATGGGTGQVLSKNSNANFDTGWIDLPEEAVWGNVSGVLSNQTDLQNALDSKYDASNPQGFITGYTVTDSDLNGLNVSSLNNDSGFITDYNVTQADVTQYESFLTITESQISDLKSYLLDAPVDGGQYVRKDGSWSTIVFEDVSWTDLTGLQSSINLSGFNNDSGFITSYTVTQADVTQYESFLTITESQISDLDKYSQSQTNALLNDKQDTLVSGTNIKTINNESVLGSGDLNIDTGGNPGGSNETIQFNNSGVFGGSNNLKWDSSATSLVIENTNNDEPGFVVNKATNDSSQTFFKFNSLNVNDGFFSLGVAASASNVFLPTIRLRGRGLDGAAGLLQGQIHSENDVFDDQFGGIILQTDRVPNTGDSGNTLEPLQNANVFLVRNRGDTAFVVKANLDSYFVGSLGVGTQNPNSKLHVNGDSFVEGSLGVGKTPGLAGDSLSIDGSASWYTGNSKYFGFSNGSPSFGSSADMTYPDAGAMRITPEVAVFDGPGIELINGNAGNSQGELRFYFGSRNYDASSTSRVAFRALVGSAGLPPARLMILENGKVGIGTINPDKLLDVNGDALVRGRINFEDSSQGVVLKSPNGSSYRLVVDDSGNLTTQSV